MEWARHIYRQQVAPVSPCTLAPRCAVRTRSSRVEKRMSTQSGAVNGKSGPMGMPETKQACRYLARKRQDLCRDWQPLRSIGRAMSAGLLAVLLASASGADPAG